MGDEPSAGNPPPHCTVFDSPSSKYDVFLLHGYKSKKSRQFSMARKIRDLGYSVILCDSRGHGVRKKVGTSEDWKESLEELNHVIDQRGKPAILIGHSLGASHAITLGMTNKNVKQVFAVAAVSGANPEHTRYVTGKFARQLKDGEITGEKVAEMQETMPRQYETCSPKNAKKFYLIHAKNDLLAPFEDFELNNEGLCLPDKNTLVYGNLVLAHVSPFYSDKTFDFIKKNLKK